MPPRVCNGRPGWTMLLGVEIKVARPGDSRAWPGFGPDNNCCFSNGRRKRDRPRKKSKWKLP